jgi:hypothetical protein
MTTPTTRSFLRAAALVSIAFLAACSDTAGSDGGTDTPIVDASGDTASDIATDRADVTMDTAMDVAEDVPVSDTPATDAPVIDSPAPDAPVRDASHDDANDASSSCSPSQPCHPYFCGCGSCNPADIICVSDSRSCPLACPISCPELATTVCECTGGSCAVVHSDGGTASDGGGGTAGSSCMGDGDCMSGLLCCYPCGIPGCTNQCMAPMGGHCPLFP